MRICQACSKENPDYINHCLDCGRNVNPAAGNSRRKTYAVIGIIAGAAVVFAGLKQSPFLSDTTDAGAKKMTVTLPAASGQTPERPKVAEENRAASSAPMLSPAAPPGEAGSGPPAAGNPTGPISQTEPAAIAPPTAEQKPRKRLQNQPLDTADIIAGNSPIPVLLKLPSGKQESALKSPAEAYLRSLHRLIVSEFNESLARKNLTNELGAQALATIKINSRSGQIELLAISDNLDIVQQSLLRRVVMQCSEKVSCPRELYEECGEFLTLDLPLATKP